MPCFATHVRLLHYGEPHNRICAPGLHASMAVHTPLAWRNLRWATAWLISRWQQVFFSKDIWLLVDMRNAGCVQWSTGVYTGYGAHEHVALHEGALKMIKIVSKVHGLSLKLPYCFFPFCVNWFKRTNVPDVMKFSCWN